MALENLREEFRLRKFKCDHKQPHLFVLPQCGPKLVYIIWVIAWALYHTIWLFAMEPYVLWREGKLTFDKWCIYLTNWGYILLTASSVLNMATCLYVHRNRTDIINGSSETMAWYLKTVWVLFNMSNTVGITITLGYFTSMAVDYNADSVATHIVNSIYVILNILVGAKPVQILHFYQPVIFLIIYGVFYVVYQVCGGVSIYPELDISDLQRAAITACCVVFIGVPTIHCVVFCLYKLKTGIHTYIQHDAAKSSASSEDDSPKV